MTNRYKYWLIALCYLHGGGSMVVSHNFMAMNAQRQFNIVGNVKRKSMEKLSSGYKINRAADDAAGLAISEKMRRQIRGLNQGTENMQDGISLVQVADGALAEVQEMLQRMTELSVKAANGTNTDEDRQYIQQEIQQLSNEINRIGKTTSFNGLLLFDDMFGEEVEGSVTNLVSSPAANSGFLTESIKIGSLYYPSASIDFSNINSRNISKLNNQGFSFTCSQSCGEVFDIKFATDGTPSSARNLEGKVKHDYVVDISNCKNGKDIVDAVYSYISAHIPNGFSVGGITSDSLKVSHSNELLKSDDGNKLIIASNTGLSSKAAAESKYPGADRRYGAVDCSQLTGIVVDEKINEILIQCSGEVDDVETIYTHRMNADLLGVAQINVSSIIGAQSALGIVKKANDNISTQRSELGAFQNRLEHAVNSNNNVSENTTAAESRTRDTDMSKEMVALSKQNILEQVGQSMMAQANQSNQGVLSLLQ